MQHRPNIPGFEIRGELGRGGMATVYLAIQLALERKVALKVMDAAMAASDPSFQERFLREGRVIARVNHPNIVTVYDTNYADGVYYIAMEYLPGGSLKERIQRRELDVPTTLMMVRALASALGLAHSRGIVHRDLKPLNVLFRADQPQPVLTDFGVARVGEAPRTGKDALGRVSQTLQPLTQIGVSVGTPAYMSPEQVLALPDVDGRADLYSLGIMFYEMLIGQRPFVSDDPYEVARMHVETPPPRLPHPLRHLQAILDRLLEKRPQNRYPDAAALVQALDAWEQTVAGEVPVVTPPTTADAATVAVVVPSEAALAATVPVAVPPTRPVAPPTLPPTRPVATVTETVPLPAAPTRVRWGVAAGAATVLLAGLVAGGWWLWQPAPVALTPTQQLEQLLIRPWTAAEIEQALALGEQLRAGPTAADPLLRNLAARLAQTLRNLPDAESRRESWRQRGLALAPAYPALLALQPTQVPTAAPVTQDPQPKALLAQERVAQLQAQAQVQLAAGKWVEPVGDNAEETYRALRLWDAAAAEQGLQGLADILYRQAQMAWERRDTETAKRWLNQAQARFPTDSRWVTLAQQWEALPPRPELAQLSVPELLALAQRQFDTAQVTDPPGDNAVDTYREVLRRQANQAQAQAALRQIADGFEALAQARQRKGELEKARLAVERGLQVVPEHAGLRKLSSQLQ